MMNEEFEVDESSKAELDLDSLIATTETLADCSGGKLFTPKVLEDATSLLWCKIAC